ncbi:MAG: tetratricopeptide repeat protein [Phycisphaerae bacterium]|nr:tetratricopeptide repeat protein [Phycisphaerae bacterium]MDW8263204.1 tetratricopeptide repeat protein [Phycisphaerales bacterium]
MRENRPGGADWLIMAVLAASVAALYTRTVNFEFVNYDDDQYVFENPHIRSGLTFPAIAWAFTSVYASNWHPLTWISHMLDVELFGLSPGGPHAVNLLLHAANACLLYEALRRLTGDRWPAAFAAAFFAVHPLRVESVAWVSERKDVLSGLFWMLTLVAYERYARRATAGGYLTVLGMFVLGLLSKPMVVTLPFVLLLLDYWPLRRFASERWARVVLEKAPLLALAMAGSVVTYYAQKAGQTMPDEGAVPLEMRLANAVISYCVYLRQTVWPVNLAVFYPHPSTFIGVRPATGAIIGCISFLASVSVAAVVLVRRAPWFAVGWAWYLGTLVPVIGLVQVGQQSHADRYTYLTVIGASIAAFWSVHAILRRFPGWRVPATLGGLIVLTALAVLSWRQVGVWRDSETLMRHAIAVVPNNYLAYNNLGHELVRKGDRAGAEAAFREMLRINPNDVGAMNNIAVELSARGEFAEAESLYRRAMKVNPDFILSYVHLGNLYARRGQHSAARELYQQALARNPDSPEAHHNLAALLAESGDYPAALEHWRTALRLKPDYADALHGYGLGLLVSGRADEGIQMLREALRIEPDRVDTLLRLAWVLATHPQPRFRNPADALRLASRAAELQRQPDAVLLDTLAAARAQNGDFTGAIAAAEEALRLADPNTTLSQEIRQRLELYRSGRAYVQGAR